tara:strand:+ start:1264 stop:2409 length:1146 start_codon:yes stop_codon:yes gene_type:complete
MKKILLTTLLFCFIVAEDEFFEPATSLGGYGEMHFDMKANDGDGKLDFHRFIFYIKHQFSPQWSMMSEIEVEHNMVGSEKALGYKGGYLAMEQAHLNYWNGNWGFKGGVLLVPAGIINEYHEPPTFMSVERPEYAKYIIPTTWFDNGFAFYGKLSDFNWNVTFTGDLDGDDISNGIRSAREKGHYSKASSWTKTVQGSYTGITGLKVGGSMTMNDAPTDAVDAVDAIDATTEYVPVWNETTEMWDMEEVITEAVDAVDAIPAGTVGVSLTEFNATYAANNIYARMEYGVINYTNNPDGVESSSGYYVDLGYDIASLIGCDDDTSLYLWTRLSSYNRDDAKDPKDIMLYGVTYKPMNNISFKFETGTAGDDDVMRVGLGYMF